LINFVLSFIYVTFAFMNDKIKYAKDMEEKEKWSENIIIADADYIDAVAFDLTVNFERMLGRRILKADMGKWIDCVALDGGLREGKHETQVVLIHSKEKATLNNFTPACFADELNGKAFCDNLGEFIINALPTEDITTSEDFFIDIMKMACAQKEVTRVMLIPNAEKYYDSVRMALKSVDDDKRITVFAMQPMQGGNFRQEILGYSLMAALGINGDELNEK
jgi:hypothetical protein